MAKQKAEANSAMAVEDVKDRDRVLGKSNREIPDSQGRSPVNSSWSAMESSQIHGGPLTTMGTPLTTACNGQLILLRFFLQQPFLCNMILSEQLSTPHRP